MPLRRRAAPQSKRLLQPTSITVYSLTRSLVGTTPELFAIGRHQTNCVLTMSISFQKFRLGVHTLEGGETEKSARFEGTNLGGLPSPQRPAIEWPINHVTSNNALPHPVRLALLFVPQIKCTVHTRGGVSRAMEFPARMKYMM